MDNNFLSVNWPSSKSKNNEHLSTASNEDKNEKSCFLFNIFKRSKKSSEDNLENQNKQQSYINNSNGKARDAPV